MTYKKGHFLKEKAKLGRNMRMENFLQKKVCIRHFFNGRKDFKIHENLDIFLKAEKNKNECDGIANPYYFHRNGKKKHRGAEVLSRETGTQKLSREQFS